MSRYDKYVVNVRIYLLPVSSPTMTIQSGYIQFECYVKYLASVNFHQVEIN